MRRAVVFALSAFRQVATVLLYVGIVLLGMHVAFSVCGR